MEVFEKKHEIIKKYVKDIKNSLFYICGPESMKILCKRELKALGIKTVVYGY